MPARKTKSRARNRKYRSFIQSLTNRFLLTSTAYERGVQALSLPNASHVPNSWTAHIGPPYLSGHWPSRARQPLSAFLLQCDHDESWHVSILCAGNRPRLLDSMSFHTHVLLAVAPCSPIFLSAVTTHHSPPISSVTSWCLAGTSKFFSPRDPTLPRACMASRRELDAGSCHGSSGFAITVPSDAQPMVGRSPPPFVGLRLVRSISRS